MNVLIVVDMQRDFIDGALGTPEARAIVPAVAEKLRRFSGRVFLTRDTHEPDYLNTQEGRHLPVAHCIRDTAGWQLHPAVAEAAGEAEIVDKPTFGSTALMDRLRALQERASLDSIELVGAVYRHLRHLQRAAVQGFLPGDAGDGGPPLLRGRHAGEPPSGAGGHEDVSDRPGINRKEP